MYKTQEILKAFLNNTYARKVISYTGSFVDLDTAEYQKTGWTYKIHVKERELA